jgi:DNA-binding transcriptional ArsR family regulator
MSSKKQQKEMDSLAALFSSVAREKVLRLLMLDPTRAYYQRQIEGATGLAIRAVQRELERFVTLGLLYRREEGNRIYYRVDMEFTLFEELRSMVLKTATPPDRLRGWAALNDAVRQVFFCAEGDRVLLVTNGAARPPQEVARPFSITAMTSGEFMDGLAEDPAALAPYLSEGVDLLGRRDDVLWQRIETAGFTIEKARGVA